MTCTSFSASSSCLAANIDSTTSTCVWLNGQCVQDPCTVRSASLELCAADSNCAAIQNAGTNQLLCFSIQRVCSYLNGITCQTYPWCLKSATGDSCSYYQPGQGVNGSTTESCLSFPMWAIAIIVLWVLVMAILVGVVVLAIRQRRLDAITEVEESEVRVENVQIQDNFAPRGGLERPLNADDY